MNIEPKENFGGISGFEGYPPNTGHHDGEQFIKCDPGGGGGSDGGCTD